MWLYDSHTVCLSFCKDKSAPLDWKVRLTIARDIASALEFLHTAYHEPVIHRDVKSANVLLGATFEAKLSDFGLAVIGSVEGDLQMDPASQISVGTRPYMSPEAFQRILTTKVDVYSFGMVCAYCLRTELTTDWFIMRRSSWNLLQVFLRFPIGRNKTW
jgi:serine/threonine protein kinase